MRIEVLGDSISFPRRSKCQKLSESWPFLLGRLLGTESVLFRSKGGATSKEVADEASELASYLDAEFDLAIVQVVSEALSKVALSVGIQGAGLGVVTGMHDE